MSRVQSSSSASTVGIKDTSGNPLTSTDGALDVNIVSGGGQTPSFIYNEVASVPVGIETEVITYTAPNVSFIQSISASGSNIGEVKVYKNGVAMDKNYLSYLNYNVVFNYTTGVGSSPGVMLDQGDIISVKGLNLGQDVCNFNSKLLIIEV